MVAWSAHLDRCVNKCPVSFSPCHPLPLSITAFFLALILFSFICSLRQFSRDCQVCNMYIGTCKSEKLLGKINAFLFRMSSWPLSLIQQSVIECLVCVWLRAHLCLPRGHMSHSKFPSSNSTVTASTQSVFPIRIYPKFLMPKTT